MAVVDASSLYRFYHAGPEETLALRGVTLSVDAGEMVAVTGPSGSGKSTLLACLAGLDEPDGGHVRIGGEMLSRRSEAQRTSLRARRIGVLFQTVNLVEHLSLRENVEIARRLARGRARPSVDELLAELGIASRSQARPSELSGGEGARAGLAVALANEPDVVLADEPTGELDDDNARRLAELLRTRARAGTAVVIVTHDPMLAAAADRVVRLHDGQIAP